MEAEIVGRPVDEQVQPVGLLRVDVLDEDVVRHRRVRAGVAHGRLDGRLRAAAHVRLAVAREHHARIGGRLGRGRARGDVKVELLVRLRPGVPAQTDRRGATGVEREAVGLVAKPGIGDEPVGRGGRIAGVVLQREVSGGNRPQDARLAQRAHDVGGAARGAGAVTAARGEEAERGGDDLNALLLQPGRGRAEFHRGARASQVERRLRRHRVHDLGDRRAVRGALPAVGAGAEVGRDLARQRADGLGIGEPAVAGVDDADLDAVALFPACRLPSIGAGGVEALGIDVPHGDRAVGVADVGDAGLLGERGDLVRGHGDLGAIRARRDHLATGLRRGVLQRGRLTVHIEHQVTGLGFRRDLMRRRVREAGRHRCRRRGLGRDGESCRPDRDRGGGHRRASEQFHAFSIPLVALKSTMDRRGRGTPVPAGCSG